MRRLILVALAACGGSDSPDCPQVARSDIEHGTDVIISGPDRIAISWTRSVRGSRPEIHGSIVTADGTLSPDIALQETSSRGAVGKSTMVWMTGEPCAQPLAFSITLQHETGTVRWIDVAPMTNSRAVVFDGTRYHVFWTIDGVVRFQTVDEDGTLGAVRTLAGVPGTCVEAASDGAGLTFLRADLRGYFVDTAAGTAQMVFTSPQPIGSGETFYFAGKFHIANDSRLMSIAPGSTGAFTEHFLDGDLTGARAFYPAGDTLFVEAFTGLVEVDASLETVRELAIETIFPMGALAGDLVRFDRTTLDVGARQPARIELIRENAWTKEVAVDSPVRFEDACEPVDF